LIWKQYQIEATALKQKLSDANLSILALEEDKLKLIATQEEASKVRELHQLQTQLVLLQIPSSHAQLS
jgi:hypothetical protein